MAAPVAPQQSGKSFLKRELNGATFLTLEHIGHMVLVVAVPALILSGIVAAMSMWFGTPGMATMLMGGSSQLLGASAAAVEGAMSLSIVAALFVLVPLLVVLDRRTRAEWHKRPGFAGRLAYKVPVYTALAALATFVVGCKINMLYVVIASLAFIGVPGAPIGDMYVNGFVPSLLGLVVFSAAGWYLFTLAKGRDNGRLFSVVSAVAGVAIMLALFITTLVVVHNGSKQYDDKQTTPGSSEFDSEYYRDLMDKYYQ